MRLIIISMLFVAIFSANSFAADKVLDIKEITTNKGIKIWYVEDKSLPIISMSFGFKGAGSVNESADKQGLVQLLSNTMDEGAGKYDSQEFQKILADKSISLYFSSNRDDFTGNLKTLSKYRDKAFELLKLAINEPRFDEEPVSRMKQANIARIKSSLSDPEWIAARILNDVAYKGHSYAQNSGGTVRTIENIKIDELKKYAKTYFGKNNLMIAVTGDIGEDELKTRIDDIFGNLNNVEIPRKEKISIKSSGKIISYEMDIGQSVVRIYQNGIDRNHPDYQAAKVMNHILGGGGFGSRLTEEVREKRGLTYGIYSRFISMDYADLFKISTSTKNESVNEAIAIIKNEINKISENGVSQKELDDARNYLLGSLPLSLSSTDRISNLMLNLQLSGRTADYLDIRKKEIENLKIEDIKRVASGILDSNLMNIVIVGKADESINIDQKIKNIPNAE